MKQNLGLILLFILSYFFYYEESAWPGNSYRRANLRINRTIATYFFKVLKNKLNENKEVKIVDYSDFSIKFHCYICVNVLFPGTSQGNCDNKNIKALSAETLIFCSNYLSNTAILPKGKM